MNLKRKLDIIFEETTTTGTDPFMPPRRYIARSLDGGTGWGVYDRRAGRFLTDREVRQIEVREPFGN